MQRALKIKTVLAFLLTFQVSLCQAGVTSYTTSWSTTVTTKTSSISTIRRGAYSPATKNTSRCSIANPIITSTADPVIRKVGNGSNDHNCVLYLRHQRGIKLPSQDLTSYASKLSIINSSVPQGKSVAIIKTPGGNARIGHLAEVTGLEQKDGKVTMQLSEANNPNRGYYERTITGKSLGDIQKNANIVGYYVEPHETIKVPGTQTSRYL